MLNRYAIPTEPPKYVARRPEKSISRKRFYGILDSVFATYGLFLTFWFVVLLLISGLGPNWRSLLFLALFWLMLTYFALPRLHQMFTTWYLPDYFMARTKTGDGILGDPVNLAIDGSEADIHAAMSRAGWVRADEITLRSSLGIVRSSITGNSYPAAPVSNLYLFGKRHDFAYQQEVDGNAAQRHHIRFWRVPEGWELPGGRRVDWLAAGTYDRSVGLSTMTLQITHKIDADVDAERDYVINTVRYQDSDCTVAVIEKFSTAFHDENGGGDSVMTDGDMPILNVTGAAQRAKATGLELVGEDGAGSKVANNLLNEELPPKSLLFVGIFLWFYLALAVVSLFTIDVWDSQNGFVSQRALFTFGEIIFILIFMLLLHLTVRKYRWPRLIFLILTALAGTSELLVLSSHLDSPTNTYLEAALSVLLVLAFSAPSVREWVYTLKRRGGNTPIGL